MRPGPPGWGYQPPPHLYPRRRPALGGVAVLVVVTVLAALAAPHARTVRGLVADELAELPAIGRPGRAPATGDGARAGRAVTFALRQRGKPYRWGAEGPHAFDCSGLTWAAWRAAGVTIPRTAAGQLAGLPRVHGRLRPGDLVIYPSRGPSRRACGDGRRPGPDGRGPGPRYPGPLDQHPRWLAGGRPTGARPMTAAAFLDFLGWDGLTAAEQAAGLGGACLGLAVWLLARALFGGRRQR